MCGVAFRRFVRGDTGSRGVPQYRLADRPRSFGPQGVDRRAARVSDDDAIERPVTVGFFGADTVVRRAVDGRVPNCPVVRRSDGPDTAFVVDERRVRHRPLTGGILGVDGFLVGAVSDGGLRDRPIATGFIG